MLAHRLLVYRLAPLMSAAMLLDASPTGAWPRVAAQDEPVVLDASQTQVVRSQHHALLVVRLAIVNPSPAPLDFKAADLTLHAGDYRLAATPPNPKYHGLTILVDGEDQPRPISELPPLANGNIEPGGKIEGWLLFDLAPMNVRPEKMLALSELDWRLAGNIGAIAVDFDLRAHEVAALAARRRPCRDEPSVPVIEIGGRLNSLNVGKLVELALGPADKPAGSILRFMRDDCRVEQFVRDQWHRLEYPNARVDRLHRRPVRCVLWQEEPRPKQWRVWSRGAAPTETLAMLRVLAGRPDSTALILKHVGHESAEVRAAAVSSLGNRQLEPGAFDALIAAVADDDPTVRLAALKPLQYWRRSTLGRAGRDDGPAGDAVAAALDDANQPVRLAAVAAASGLTGDRLNAPLLALLTDADPAMRAAAAHSLGDRRCAAAEPALRRLWQEDSIEVKVAAVSALDQLGVLADGEAALARLDLGRPYQLDVETLINLRDPAMIPKLFALAQRAITAAPRDQSPMFQQEFAALEVLTDMALPDTVEPLIRLLATRVEIPEGRDAWQHRHRARLVEQRIVRGLARLGDRRAIEPLREALERADDTLSDTLYLHEALIGLAAPGALDGLVDVKNHVRVADARRLLDMLASYDDDQSAADLERLLEDHSFASDAAEKLSYLSRPSARTALERCLLPRDARIDSRWLEGLARNPLWLVRPGSRELIERVANSQYKATRAAAKALLAKLDAAPQDEPDQPAPTAPPDFLPPDFNGPLAVPAGLNLAIDFTQFTRDSFEGALYLRLTLENRTDQPLAYRANDFLLRAGKRWLAASKPAPRPSTLWRHMRMTAGGDNDAGEPPPIDSVRLPAALGGEIEASEVPYLSDGSLPPHGKTPHWLRFELLPLETEVGAPLDTETDTWLLVGRVGDNPFALDLKAVENEALEVRRRRSTTDERVAVAELSGRLNNFNYAKFRAAIAEAPVDEPGIILLPDETWLADPVVHARWQRDGERLLSVGTIREGDTVTRVLTMPGTVGLTRKDTIRRAPDTISPTADRERAAWLPTDRLVVSGVLLDGSRLSEGQATVGILEQRPNTGRALIGHLRDDDAKIRRAAAFGLIFHLREQGAVEALIAALDDPDGDVRLAAASALGANNVDVPPGMRRDDSPACAALMRHIKGDDQRLAYRAMHSLAAFSGPGIDAALLKVLDEPSPDVIQGDERDPLSGNAGIACRILADRHCRVAIDRYRDILASPRRSGDVWRRAGAISVLAGIGELSPADALLGKMALGQLTHAEPEDFVSVRDDPRIVAALIERLTDVRVKRSMYGQSSAPALRDPAWTLAIMGATEAIDPMLALLARGAAASDPLPLVRALAKLGDRRAIEPIRRALSRAAPDWRLRLDYYQALARLGDDEAIKTLIALVQSPLAEQDARRLLSLLGGIHDERVPAVVEPFLDRRGLCTAAAEALGQLPPELALPPLERRLSSADYRFGRWVLQSLARRATWWDGPAGRSLVKLAAASPSPATRHAAAEPLDD